MAKVQRPLQDYPEGFCRIIKIRYRRIREGKEDEQEVRVSDFVRHAQA